MKFLITVLLLAYFLVIAGCSGSSLQMMNIENSIRSATSVVDVAKGFGGRVLSPKEEIPIIYDTGESLLSTQQKLDRVDSFVSQVESSNLETSTSQTFLDIRKHLMEAKVRLSQVNSARQMGPGSSDNQGVHQRYLDLCMQSLRQDLEKLIRDNGDVCKASELLSIL